MELGEKIKYHRERLGMTLEELGNKVGVGKSTVRKWETGMIANMRRDKIDKIATALEVSPAYLMGWTDKPGPNYSLADNIDIAFWRDVDEGRIKVDDYIDEYELSNDEEKIITNYRKLSPHDKKAVSIMIQTMADNTEPSAPAADLDKTIEEKQQDEEVYTVNNARVLILNHDGSKAKVISLNDDGHISDALAKYHPVPARSLVSAKPNKLSHIRKNVKTGDKIAKKKG